MTLVELQAEAYKVIMQINYLNNRHIELQQEMQKLNKEEKKED
jgi:hypothetical protein